MGSIRPIQSVLTKSAVEALIDAIMAVGTVGANVRL